MMTQDIQHSSAELAKRRLQQITRGKSLHQVEAVKTQLPDADGITRLQIVEALDGIGSDDALDALGQMLPDPDPDVHQAIVQIFLRPRKSSAQALFRLLTHPETRLQEAALDIIVDSGDSRYGTFVAGYVYALLANVLTMNETLGERAVQFLQGIESNEASTAISEWRTRFPLPTPQARPQPMSESIPFTRNRAKDLVNYHQAFQTLIKHIRAGRWGDQQKASKALHSLVRELPEDIMDDAIRMFTDALEDRNPLVRWASVEAMAWLHNVNTIPTLGRCVQDPNWSVRLAAIRALIEIGDVGCARWIEPALNDDHSSVQEAALEAIGKLGNRRQAEKIEAILNDAKDPIVRAAAAEAARKLGITGIAPTLIRLLSAGHPNLKWAAARSLSELAGESDAAVMTLYLQDDTRPDWEEQTVGDWMRIALQRINTDEAKAALRQLGART
jgi:HEAT repeat protein